MLTESRKNGALRGRRNATKEHCFKVGETSVVLHNWEQSSVEERIDDIEGRLINCRCSDFEHVKEDRLLCTRGGIAFGEE